MCCCACSLFFLQPHVPCSLFTTGRKRSAGFIRCFSLTCVGGQEWNWVVLLDICHGTAVLMDSSGGISSHQPNILIPHFLWSDSSAAPGKPPAQRKYKIWPWTPVGVFIADQCTFMALWTALNAFFMLFLSCSVENTFDSLASHAVWIHCLFPSSKLTLIWKFL